MCKLCKRLSRYLLAIILLSTTLNPSSNLYAKGPYPEPDPKKPAPIIPGLDDVVKPPTILPLYTIENYLDPNLRLTPEQIEALQKRETFQKLSKEEQVNFIITSLRESGMSGSDFQKGLMRVAREDLTTNAKILEFESQQEENIQIKRFKLFKASQLYALANNNNESKRLLSLLGLELQNDNQNILAKLLEVQQMLLNNELDRAISTLQLIQVALHDDGEETTKFLKQIVEKELDFANHQISATRALALLNFAHQASALRAEDRIKAKSGIILSDKLGIYGATSEYYKELQFIDELNNVIAQGEASTLKEAIQILRLKSVAAEEAYSKFRKQQIEEEAGLTPDKSKVKDLILIQGESTTLAKDYNKYALKKPDEHKEYVEYFNSVFFDKKSEEGVPVEDYQGTIFHQVTLDGGSLDVSQMEESTLVVVKVGEHGGKLKFRSGDRGFNPVPTESRIFTGEQTGRVLVGDGMLLIRESEGFVSKKDENYVVKLDPNSPFFLRNLLYYFDDDHFWNAYLKIESMKSTEQENDKWYDLAVYARDNNQSQVATYILKNLQATLRFGYIYEKEGSLNWRIYAESAAELSRKSIDSVKELPLVNKGKDLLSVVDLLLSIIQKTAEATKFNSLGEMHDDIEGTGNEKDFFPTVAEIAGTGFDEIYGEKLIADSTWNTITTEIGNTFNISDENIDNALNSTMEQGLLIPLSAAGGQVFRGVVGTFLANQLYNVTKGVIKNRLKIAIYRALNQQKILFFTKLVADGTGFSLTHRLMLAGLQVPNLWDSPTNIIADIGHTTAMLGFLQLGTFFYSPVKAMLKPMRKIPGIRIPVIIVDTAGGLTAEAFSLTAFNAIEELTKIFTSDDFDKPLFSTAGMQERFEKFLKEKDGKWLESFGENVILILQIRAGRKAINYVTGNVLTKSEQKFRFDEAKFRDDAKKIEAEKKATNPGADSQNTEPALETAPDAPAEEAFSPPAASPPTGGTGGSTGGIRGDNLHRSNFRRASTGAGLGPEFEPEFIGVDPEQVTSKIKANLGRDGDEHSPRIDGIKRRQQHKQDEEKAEKAAAAPAGETKQVKTQRCFDLSKAELTALAKKANRTPEDNRRMGELNAIIPALQFSLEDSRPGGYRINTDLYDTMEITRSVEDMLDVPPERFTALTTRTDPGAVSQVVEVFADGKGGFLVGNHPNERTREIFFIANKNTYNRAHIFFVRLINTFDFYSRGWTVRKIMDFKSAESTDEQSIKFLNTGYETVKVFVYIDKTPGSSKFVVINNNTREVLFVSDIAKKKISIIDFISSIEGWRKLAEKGSLSIKEFLRKIQDLEESGLLTTESKPPEAVLRDVRFNVGGVNRTEDLAAIEQINWVKIRAIEVALSSENDTVNLRELLAADNRVVVDERGLSHQVIAEHLANLRNSGDGDVKYRGQNFEIEVKTLPGYSTFPFDHDRLPWGMLTIKNKATGKSIDVLLSIIEAIRKYGFYGLAGRGKNTNLFRTNPSDIIEVLGAVLRNSRGSTGGGGAGQRTGENGRASQARRKVLGPGPNYPEDDEGPGYAEFPGKLKPLHRARGQGVNRTRAQIETRLREIGNSTDPDLVEETERLRTQLNTIAGAQTIAYLLSGVIPSADSVIVSDDLAPGDSETPPPQPAKKTSRGDEPVTTKPVQRRTDGGTTGPIHSDLNRNHPPTQNARLGNSGDDENGLNYESPGPIGKTSQRTGEEGVNWRGKNRRDSMPPSGDGGLPKGPGMEGTPAKAIKETAPSDPMEDVEASDQIPKKDPKSEPERPSGVPEKPDETDKPLIYVGKNRIAFMGPIPSRRIVNDGIVNGHIEEISRILGAEPNSNILIPKSKLEDVLSKVRARINSMQEENYASLLGVDLAKEEAVISYGDMFSTMWFYSKQTFWGFLSKVPVIKGMVKSFYNKMYLHKVQALTSKANEEEFVEIPTWLIPFFVKYGADHNKISQAIDIIYSRLTELQASGVPLGRPLVLADVEGMPISMSARAALTRYLGRGEKVEFGIVDKNGFVLLEPTGEVPLLVKLSGFNGMYFSQFNIFKWYPAQTSILENGVDSLLSDLSLVLIHEIGHADFNAAGYRPSVVLRELFNENIGRSTWNSADTIGGQGIENLGSFKNTIQALQESVYEYIRVQCITNLINQGYTAEDSIAEINESLSILTGRELSGEDKESISSFIVGAVDNDGRIVDQQKLNPILNIVHRHLRATMADIANVTKRQLLLARAQQIFHALTEIYAYSLENENLDSVVATLDAHYKHIFPEQLDFAQNYLSGDKFAQFFYKPELLALENLSQGFGRAKTIAKIWERRSETLNTVAKLQFAIVKSLFEDKALNLYAIDPANIEPNKARVEVIPIVKEAISFLLDPILEQAAKQNGLNRTLTEVKGEWDKLDINGFSTERNRKAFTKYASRIIPGIIDVTKRTLLDPQGFFKNPVRLALGDKVFTVQISNERLIIRAEDLDRTEQAARPAVVKSEAEIREEVSKLPREELIAAVAMFELELSQFIDSGTLRQLALAQTMQGGNLDWAALSSAQMEVSLSIESGVILLLRLDPNYSGLKERLKSALRLFSNIALYEYQFDTSGISFGQLYPEYFPEGATNLRSFIDSLDTETMTSPHIDTGSDGEFKPIGQAADTKVRVEKEITANPINSIVIQLKNILDVLELETEIKLLASKGVKRVWIVLKGEHIDRENYFENTLNNRKSKNPVVLMTPGDDYYDNVISPSNGPLEIRLDRTVDAKTVKTKISLKGDETPLEIQNAIRRMLGEEEIIGESDRDETKPGDGSDAPKPSTPGVTSGGGYIAEVRHLEFNRAAQPRISRSGSLGPDYEDFPNHDEPRIGNDRNFRQRNAVDPDPDTADDIAARVLRARVAQTASAQPDVVVDADIREGVGAVLARPKSSETTRLVNLLDSDNNPLAILPKENKTFTLKNEHVFLGEENIPFRWKWLLFGGIGYPRVIDIVSNGETLFALTASGEIYKYDPQTREFNRHRKYQIKIYPRVKAPFFEWISRTQLLVKHHLDETVIKISDDVDGHVAPSEAEKIYTVAQRAVLPVENITAAPARVGMDRPKIVPSTSAEAGKWSRGEVAKRFVDSLKVFFSQRYIPRPKITIIVSEEDSSFSWLKDDGTRRNVVFEPALEEEIGTFNTIVGLSSYCRLFFTDRDFVFVLDNISGTLAMLKDSSGNPIKLKPDQTTWSAEDRDNIGNAISKHSISRSMEAAMRRIDKNISSRAVNTAIHEAAHLTVNAILRPITFRATELTVRLNPEESERGYIADERRLEEEKGLENAEFLLGEYMMEGPTALMTEDLKKGITVNLASNIGTSLAFGNPRFESGAHSDINKAWNYAKAIVRGKSRGGKSDAADINKPLTLQEASDPIFLHNIFRELEDGAELAAKTLMKNVILWERIVYEVSCKRPHPGVDGDEVGLSRQEIDKIINQYSSEAKPRLIFDQAYIDEVTEGLMVYFLLSYNLNNSPSEPAFEAAVYNPEIEKYFDQLRQRRITAEDYISNSTVLASNLGSLSDIFVAIEILIRYPSEKSIQRLVELLTLPEDSEINVILKTFTREQIEAKWGDRFLVDVMKKVKEASNAGPTFGQPDLIGPTVETNITPAPTNNDGTGASDTPSTSPTTPKKPNSGGGGIGGASGEWGRESSSGRHSGIAGFLSAEAGMGRVQYSSVVDVGNRKFGQQSNSEIDMQRWHTGGGTSSGGESLGDNNLAEKATAKTDLPKRPEVTKSSEATQRVNFLDHEKNPSAILPKENKTFTLKNEHVFLGGETIPFRWKWWFFGGIGHPKVIDIVSNGEVVFALTDSGEIYKYDPQTREFNRHSRYKIKIYTRESVPFFKWISRTQLLVRHNSDEKVIKISDDVAGQGDSGEAEKIYPVKQRAALANEEIVTTPAQVGKAPHEEIPVAPARVEKDPPKLEIPTSAEARKWGGEEVAKRFVDAIRLFREHKPASKPPIIGTIISDGDSTFFWTTPDGTKREVVFKAPLKEEIGTFKTIVSISNYCRLYLTDLGFVFALDNIFGTLTMLKKSSGEPLKLNLDEATWSDADKENILYAASEHSIPLYMDVAIRGLDRNISPETQNTAIHESAHLTVNSILKPLARRATVLTVKLNPAESTHGYIEDRRRPESESSFENTEFAIGRIMQAGASAIMTEDLKKVIATDLASNIGTSLAFGVPRFESGASSDINDAWSCAIAIARGKKVGGKSDAADLKKPLTNVEANDPNFLKDVFLELEAGAELAAKTLINNGALWESIINAVSNKSPHTGDDGLEVGLSKDEITEIVKQFKENKTERITSIDQNYIDEVTEGLMVYFLLSFNLNNSPSELAFEASVFNPEIGKYFDQLRQRRITAEDFISNSAVFATYVGSAYDRFTAIQILVRYPSEKSIQRLVELLNPYEKSDINEIFRKFTMDQIKAIWGEGLLEDILRRSEEPTSAVTAGGQPGLIGGAVGPNEPPVQINKDGTGASDTSPTLPTTPRLPNSGGGVTGPASGEWARGSSAGRRSGVTRAGSLGPDSEDFQDYNEPRVGQDRNFRQRNAVEEDPEAADARAAEELRARLAQAKPAEDIMQRASEIITAAFSDVPKPREMTADKVRELRTRSDISLKVLAALAVVDKDITSKKITVITLRDYLRSAKEIDSETAVWLNDVLSLVSGVFSADSDVVDECRRSIKSKRVESIDKTSLPVREIDRSEEGQIGKDDTGGFIHDDFNVSVAPKIPFKVSAWRWLLLVRKPSLRPFAKLINMASYRIGGSEAGQIDTSLFDEKPGSDLLIGYKYDFSLNTRRGEQRISLNPSSRRVATTIYFAGEADFVEKWNIVRLAIVETNKALSKDGDGRILTAEISVQHASGGSSGAAHPASITVTIDTIDPIAERFLTELRSHLDLPRLPGEVIERTDTAVYDKMGEPVDSAGAASGSENSLTKLFQEFRGLDKGIKDYSLPKIAPGEQKYVDSKTQRVRDRENSIYADFARQAEVFNRILLNDNSGKHIDVDINQDMVLKGDRFLDEWREKLKSKTVSIDVIRLNQDALFWLDYAKGPHTKLPRASIKPAGTVEEMFIVGTIIIFENGLVRAVISPNLVRVVISPNSVSCGEEEGQKQEKFDPYYGLYQPRIW